MFPFDLPENIRKAKVFSSFQGDQKETFGRKGLSGNCEVIYFYRRKCSSSHLELLPEKIFLAIEVSTVFQARWRRGGGWGVGGAKAPSTFLQRSDFFS